MKYKRYIQPGGTYFFTVVTYNRKRVFSNTNNISSFMNAINCVQNNHPFDNLAYCILPDHIHMIWKLPDNDGDYPIRWQLIKSDFSRNYKNIDEIPTASRIRKHERMVWQRRYWEHYIRDDLDLKNHMEYVFYNPVKHRLAKSPFEWKYGNFSDYVSDGLYDQQWGLNIESNHFENIGHE